MIMKKVLVIGSWAKEQITLENIKKDFSYEVFSYLDTENPAIIALADGFCLGSLSDSGAILAYAKEIKPDLIMVTTASPLAAGVVDLLEDKGYKVFGPKKLSARLESDKAFARRLMRKYIPDSLPEFGVFDNKKEAVKYAAKKDFQAAVKPLGLTEGLGVKVFGDQLKDGKEVERYINQILAGGDKEKVIVEERIEGEEFTLQCLVNGKIILPTPCVQDFKKLLDQDKGPNTASMGAYSAAAKILPFMKENDYSRALEIIKETITAFSRETGQTPRGFLYGQFMITASGIKLIEYNFRPGDPEWLNTLFVFQGNVAASIEALLAGEKPDLIFKEKATVSKYITPKKYPYQLNQPLEVEFSLNEIKKEGVGVYYSCGQTKEGKLMPGSERGIAFVAEAASIEKACQKVEKAVATVKGEFFHRKDIGTESQIKGKIEKVGLLRG